MSKPRHPESGYALLFILAMAAIIAIMLYMQIPRVAFEAQRDKEQLLIDRGEQYKRAIQLYVRKFNRFPVDMQALENTQNIRFLRKQYVDPMTGKNEWRLIHVGPNGALIDSKVSGTSQSKDPASAPSTLIAQLAIGDPTSANQNVNQATRRRASDEPGAPGDPNNSTGGTPGPVMVLPDGRIVPATSTGIPATTSTTNTPPAPGQPVQPGAVPQGGFQSTPNAPSGGAANLINQILTTPRPGGLNGLGGSAPTGFGGTTAGGLTNNAGGPANNTGVSAGTGLGGTTVGGGIAGVASKMEQEGIKIYNTQTSYDKWEFVYDMSKDKTRGGGAGVPAPQQPNPAQQQQGNQPAQPAAAPATTPPPGTPGSGN